MAKGSTNTIVVVGGKSGASSFTVPSCANVTARSASGKIYIKWTDPDNIYDGGKLISWTKSEVRLIVSSSSDDDAYPKKVTDGTLVGTFTTKNQYKTTELEFTPPSTIGADANCRIMVYAHCSIAGDTKDYVNGEYEAQASAQFQIKSYSTWTVVIDESNSNPLSCCTYADDAVGMTKGSDEWDEIFGYKPCVFKDGAVYKYLNPNDFTKFADGTDATSYITDSNLLGYDVMIEFPRMGLNMSKSGTQVTISLTNNPNDSNFEYRAHKRGSVAKNAFYLGAYEAYSAGKGTANDLKSVSGVSPIQGLNLSLSILQAQNHGSGYEIMAFYQWTYIQCLYVLKYGNLNSQGAIGNGVVQTLAAISTGTMNSNGTCYGVTTSQSTGVKLFGMENVWGNTQKWLGGLCTDNNYNLISTTDNFTIEIDKWEYTYNVTYNNRNGYVTGVQGENGSGFVMKDASASGSSSVYYCDTSTVSGDNFPTVGAYYLSEAQAGIFSYAIGYLNTTSTSTLGSSRLMYL